MSAGRERLQHVVPRSVGDHPAAVQHDQPVDQGQERGAVRDQQQGLAGQDLLEALLEAALGAVVHGAARLVEHQDRRIQEQRPGDRDRLTLTAGQALAALADIQVEAKRMARDEVLDPGDARRAQHRLVVRERRAERDIVADRAVEQVHVLKHAANAAAQVSRVDLAQIGAVDQHRALIGLVQPEHQLLDRGLAGADAADQADPLALLDHEGDPIERRLLLPGIGEGDLPERQLALQLRAMQEARLRAAARPRAPWSGRGHRRRRAPDDSG